MDFRGGQGDVGDPGEESLSELLRSWRRRVDPRTFPSLPVHGRRSKGLTHTDVARLAGVSARWYGSLEQGREAGYSADFLDRVSAVLRLSRAERQALYLRAVGRPPALAAVPAVDAAAEMDATLQHFIDNQAPDPAVVTDLAWNMVGHNKAAELWLPGAVQMGNQMRWTFLSPEAREQLVCWERDWARPYLGQIRYERANHPKDEASRCRSAGTGRADRRPGPQQSSGRALPTSSGSACPPGTPTASKGDPRELGRCPRDVRRHPIRVRPRCRARPGSRAPPGLTWTYARRCREVGRGPGTGRAHPRAPACVPVGRKRTRHHE
ncbi:helix-turn-helix domain-containing protein [Streptomyces sp. WAC 04229]|uniref:MmyB family transcriptional regulator n=1 Tax=Streptomyces sp. WAC 04229 TaxID=2203206 RepID=UPI003D715EF3